MADTLTMLHTDTTTLGPYRLTWYATEPGGPPSGWAIVRHPNGRAAVARWYDGQWQAPAYGQADAVTYYANGWTVDAIDTVATWVHPSTARARLRQHLGLG